MSTPALKIGQAVAVQMNGLAETFLLATVTAVAEKTVTIRQWQRRGEEQTPTLGEPTVVDRARVLGLRATLEEFERLAT